MANMFRCTLASGGGALVLTVTCDADFAGLTITATDGTTTLTQPCPSSSPYEVEFRLPNAGQWTISGVISGETQSITVDIPDNVALHYIPNGSTVTPTDDIQTWLHCASIWDKAYTTISQVLADASTLQALIASNNAADYMARSTTWASSVATNQSAMSYIGLNDYCSDALLADSTWLSAICSSTYFESILNVKVPTMTSNTTPSGIVTESSTLSASAYPGYKAFDGDVNPAGTSMWIPAKLKQNSTLQYEFPTAIMPKCIDIVFRINSSWNPGTFGIEGSNDGSNWTTLINGLTASQTMTKYQLNNPSNTRYKYLRFVYYGVMQSSGGSQYLGLIGLQFYGRT